MDKVDIWAALAAKLPAGVISWRQDGRVVARDGRFIARFVAYIEANTVRERLDSVVPGEWDLTLDPLPTVAGLDEDANMGVCNFKARLSILGVIREDVGTGKDWKQAATDAMKRVAVRFGVGHELYDFEQNWVQMDGDGKFARPVEDPGTAYARRYGGSRAVSSGAEGHGAGAKSATAVSETENGAGVGPSASQQGAPASPSAVDDDPSCPKCGGRVWDNRLTKRNPKAPDYKCRDRACDGVIWPPKPNPSAMPFRPGDEAPHPADDEEVIPF